MWIHFDDLPWGARFLVVGITFEKIHDLYASSAQCPIYRSTVIADGGYVAVVLM